MSKMAIGVTVTSSVLVFKTSQNNAAILLCILRGSLVLCELAAPCVRHSVPCVGHGAGGGGGPAALPRHQGSSYEALAETRRDLSLEED